MSAIEKKKGLQETKLIPLYAQVSIRLKASVRFLESLDAILKTQSGEYQKEVLDSPTF